MILRIRRRIESRQCGTYGEFFLNLSRSMFHLGIILHRRVFNDGECIKDFRRFDLLRFQDEDHRFSKQEISCVISVDWRIINSFILILGNCWCWNVSMVCCLNFNSDHLPNRKQADSMFLNIWWWVLIRINIFSTVDPIFSEILLFSLFHEKLLTVYVFQNNFPCGIYGSKFPIRNRDFWHFHCTIGLFPLVFIIESWL